MTSALSSMVSQAELELTPFLDQLSEAARKDFLEAGSTKTFRDGELISSAGTEAVLATVLSGSVQLEATNIAGRRTSLPLIAKGHVFGEASAFQGSPHIFDAVAVGRSRIHFVSPSTFERLCSQHPEIAMKMLSNAAERVLTMVSALDVLRKYSVVEQVALLIHKISRTAPSENKKARVAYVTQSSLVSMTGSSRPTIARALAELRDKRLIETNYRHISVPDVDALSTWLREQTLETQGTVLD